MRLKHLPGRLPETNKTKKERVSVTVMKKLCSFLLAVLLMVGVCAVPALAADVPAPGVVLEETYSDDAALFRVETDSAAASQAVASISDGKLILDNTDGTGEAIVKLAKGLPTNLSEYTVEAELTYISIKDCATDDSRYVAFCINYADPTNYIGAWVRYNGTVWMQRRQGTSYASLGRNIAGDKDTALATDAGCVGGLAQSYRLKLHYHDNKMDLYLNGTKVLAGSNGFNFGTRTDAIAVMIKKGMKVSVDSVKVDVMQYSSGEEEEVKMAALNRMPSENYAPVIYDEVTNPESKPYGSWMAGDNQKYYLSDMEFESLASAGRVATKDAVYKAEIGSGLRLAQTMTFDKGFGTHPAGDYKDENPNYSYILVDVSRYTDPDGEFKCDTLYAAVGLTNKDSAGIWFTVMADYGDGNGFVQIACSDKIVKYNIGEFQIHIAGVKKLNLLVTADSKYASSACGWGECSIYAKDPNAVKPDYSVKEEDNTTGSDTGTPGSDEQPGSQSTARTDEPATPGNTGTTVPGTNDAKSPSKGCQSSAPVGIAAVLAALLAGAVILLRKRKD